MKLVERAKEDIYFAEWDREVIEKLRGQLQKVEKTDGGSFVGRGADVEV